MGLLDAFSDPDTAGLLSAAAVMLDRSGPSRTPSSLGQVLSGGLLGGMQGYSASKQSKREQEKEQMQMDLLKQQVAQATRKNGLINDMLAQYAGGGAALADQQPGAGANLGGAGPIAQGGLVGSIPREAIAHDFAFNDGKNVSDWMFKRGTPDMQVSNGFAYDKNQVKPGFLPQLNTSQDGKSSMITIGGDGLPVVTAPRGAVETFGAYKDLEKKADARYNPITLPLPGGPRMITGDQLPDVLNSQPKQQFKGQEIFAQLPPPLQQAIVQQARQDGNLAQNINYRLPDGRLLSGEVDFSKTVADTGPGLPLENKDRTAVTTKIASERLSTLEKDAQSQQNILSQLNIAKRLITEGTYGNNLEGKLGMLGQNSGLYQTPQGVNTNLLAQIGNSLVLARGSLGAGVSTADADRYDKAAGDFANAQSNEQRLKAVAIMEEIAGNAFKAANAARSQYAETGSLPDYAPPKPADTKTYRDFGYSSPQDAIKDARNALLRYPGQKAEIVRRLESAGITQHGIK